MTSDSFSVICNSGVADIMLQAQQMIRTAESWLAGNQWWEDLELDPSTPAWREEYHRQEGNIREMELSWYKNLAMLLHLAFQSGQINIYFDAEDSLFWREPTSGFHGGLIFHANRHKETRLPVGTWSIHT